MTLTQPTQPNQSTRRSGTRPGGIGARVWQEGRHARLDEVLHAVVVNALGPDARAAIDREEWVSIEDAIRGPVAAAASAALERLAADLEAALPRRMPELVRRLGDHRLRAELGYD